MLTITHKMSKTKVYNAWLNMRKRCDKKDDKDYANYGGRGITYDPRWGTFEGFYSDMGDSYVEGLSLDREDVDGNYCKENCKWVPVSEQSRNRRFCIKVDYKGQERLLSDIYKESSPVVTYNRFQKRVKAGWDVDLALSTPSNSRYDHSAKRRTSSGI